VILIVGFRWPCSSAKVPGQELRRGMADEFYRPSLKSAALSHFPRNRQASVETARRQAEHPYGDWLE